MKSIGVMERIYFFYLGLYRLLRRFRRFMTLIAPLHRVRSTEGKFLGMVVMRPCMDSQGFRMITWLWLCNFK